MSKLMYEFEAVGHGDEDGFNDPVKTAFDTNLSRVVAREAIQNIIDATLDNSEPAIAEFHLHEEDIGMIPNLDDLKRIIKACKKHYPNNKQCVEHFENALRILNGTKVNVLIISDYNTRGLRGDDDDREGDYYCFLKSVGASAKAGEEGGSFGLGKGSFYAASALNTIFVSSKYGSNTSSRHVFQGKLRLVSHIGLERKVLRGNGSFGLKSEKAVRDVELIPEYFRRKKQGTDIYIPGYKDAANGRFHIIKSVLYNFWYAILKRRLVVNLHDDIRIGPDNLEQLIYEYVGPGQLTPDDETNTFPYYDAYKNGRIFKEVLPTLGEVELRLVQKHGYPNRVACFRKTGMLIQEKMFSNTARYAGVFICENDVGNGLLRDMESPNHDKWDKNSAHSKVNGEPRPEVVRADKEYKHFIKSKIKEMMSTDNRQEISIGGLEQFLHLDAKEDLENEEASGGSGELQPVERETAVEVGLEKEIITGQVNPQTVLTVASRNDKGSEDLDDPDPDALGKGKGKRGGGEGGGGGGMGGEEESGGYKTSDGEQSVRRITGLSYRSFANQLASGKIEHTLILRNGKPNIQCSVKVMVGTDESFDKVSIKKAVLLPRNAACEIIGDNQIKGIILNESGEAKVKIEFESNERFSLCPVVYEDN